MVGREELIRRQNMLGLSQHTLVDMIFDIGAKLERTQAELNRYKAGVEVEGYVTGVPTDINKDLYFASGWSRELNAFSNKRVLVLVMKEEGV